MAKFMDVTVRVNLRGLSARTQQQALLLRRLPKEFEKVVKSETPVDSGHARKNTFLVRSIGGNAKIRANYPYAVRLDTGWSKQAPTGFVKPSLEWLRNRIQQIFTKK